VLFTSAVMKSMARLEHRDLRALSEALLILYKPGPINAFPDRVYAALSHCLSFDFLGYHEVVSDYETKRAATYPDFNPDMDAFAAYLDQHPNWNAVITNRIKSPVKISDFVSNDEWRQTDLYNHIFRPIRQDYQLGFLTFDQAPQLGLAVNRSSRDFSEDERSILEFLMPHLLQAFAASRLFSEFTDAAEAGAEGYLVVEEHGTVRFATRKATAWLEEYFGRGRGILLPDQLRDWLKQRRQQALDPEYLNAPAQDYSIQRGPNRLLVQSLSPADAYEQRLILKEIKEECDAAPLQSLGLTKREAEVLLWVSKGKRNAEIAIILGTTPKTITKHLERVFQKLDVETRTAAANVALERLRVC
jgi:DNA-binding CsgD family transcriptional regulator